MSERRDSNPRPLRPERSTLPGCATLRIHTSCVFICRFQLYKNINISCISEIFNKKMPAFLIIGVSIDKLKMHQCLYISFCFAKFVQRLYNTNGQR